MDCPRGPPLPEPIFFQEKPLTDERTEGIPPLPSLYYLSRGCYFAQWSLPYSSPFNVRYNGVIRVETHIKGASASGDFYVQIGNSPDPNPSDGIPIFPRDKYFFYLRITQLLETISFGKSFTLGFERHVYGHSNKTFKKDDDFTAQMTFKTPTSSYPTNTVYLEGQIKDSSGKVAGFLKMGKVSNYLRKAVVEVDLVSHSEYPGDNGAGMDWKDVYDTVDWDLTAYRSDSAIAEKDGEFWTDRLLHEQMLESRYSANLDREWRYHLLCVRRLKSTTRGRMYDAGATDSNKLPREGAAIASHWMIPDKSPWGSVKGQRFGAASAPYFRTAVHELGHAMGLRHNYSDNCFMNVTPNIAASTGTFPHNILWSFSAEDERRLRHMPDAWVRPGMIAFGPPYSSVPISPVDGLDLSESLSFVVEPLLQTVPLGAPVRVKVTLRNKTDAAVEVPPSLSLKAGYVRGCVVGPGGSRRGFQSIMRCVDERDLRMLGPDEEMSHDLTLLRGRDGALFVAPGLHEIKVCVLWEREDGPVCVGGAAPVMIQPAVTDSHARAALKTLTTADLLLTVALGGDYLEDGVEALKVAMGDEVLAPHYAVIEAKRVGRGLGMRSGNPAAALRLLGRDAVMSVSEVSSLVEVVEGEGKAGSVAVEALRKAVVGNKVAEDVVSRLL